MKRFFFAVIALATAAVSCSKSEMVMSSDYGHEISFDTYIGKAPLTKAQSVDLGYLQGGQARGFHVNAFLHAHTDGSLTEAELGVAKPYMSKDVYWVPDTEGTTTAGIPNETATTKVIFTEAETTPDAPTISGNAFVCPENWTDFPTYSSTHYVVMTLSGEGWTAGAVTPVVLANAGGHWEYDGVTYWPDANSDKYLAFAAYGLNEYSTGDDAWTKEKGIIVKTNSSLEFNVASKVADQQDLVVAPFQKNMKINATASNTTVALNFKHVLSRVGFKLVANQTNGVEIEITEVTLEGNFATTGTVDLTLAAPAIAPGTPAKQIYSLLPETNCFFWEAQATETPIYHNATSVGTGNEYTTATPISDQTTLTANEANRYMMLMPTTAQTYTIKVNYQLEDAEPQVAEVELTNWTFAPGTSYEFVLKVSTSAVGFYVEVSDWNDYFPVTDANGETTLSGVYPLTPKVSTDNN